MRMQHDNWSESRFAAGLRAVALIVLLGLIAVVSEPVLRSSAVMDELGVLAPTSDSSAPPAPGSDAPVYFPSQYPAPTNIVEQSPTF